MISNIVEGSTMWHSDFPTVSRSRFASLALHWLCASVLVLGLGCSHAANDQTKGEDVTHANHEGVVEQDGDNTVRVNSATRFLIEKERAKKGDAPAEHRQKVLLEKEALISLLVGNGQSLADQEAVATLHLICGAPVRNSVVDSEQETLN